MARPSPAHDDGAPVFANITANGDGGGEGRGDEARSSNGRRASSSSPIRLTPSPSPRVAPWDGSRSARAARLAFEDAPLADKATACAAHDDASAAVGPKWTHSLAINDLYYDRWDPRFLVNAGGPTVLSPAQQIR